MHAIYDLKEMLCNELEEYGKKGEMSAAVLERVDMLAHAVKNLDKIIETMEESEYSSNDGMSYNRNVYDRGYSRGRGRNARRDSMGRYASDGYSRNNDGYSQNSDLVEKLRYMMDDAPDERTRQEIQRLVSKMEKM